MARPTARRCTRSRVAPWASATCAPAPTARRPTARLSASSEPCSAAGPTARSTAPAPNAPPPLTAGWTTTTISPHTLSPRPQAPDRSPQRANQPPRDLHLGILLLIIASMFIARALLRPLGREREEAEAEAGKGRGERRFERDERSSSGPSRIPETR